MASGAIWRDARATRRGGSPKVWQGPHIFGADFDDVRPGGAGVVEGSAAIAFRGGVPAPIVLPFRPDAGRELRPAGTDRNWPGRSPPSINLEPGRAISSVDRQEEEFAHAGANSAFERGIPGSDTADEFCGDEFSGDA